MQIYAVFGIRDPKLVKARIDKYYRNNYYDAGNNIFFIATEGETSHQLATKICLGDENKNGVTSGIVMTVTNYWGRYSKELWEWINVKQNANGG